MNKKSKYLKTFLNNVIYYDADIEMIDILLSSVKQGRLGTDSDEYVFLDLEPDRHKVLAKRKKSNHSRRLVVTHLKITLYESYIKGIYESLTYYLKDLVNAAAKSGISAARFAGNYKKTYTFKEVLDFKSWDNVVEQLSQDLFQSLESERSTKKLLTDINSKLGLDIDDKLIDEALPYLEVRHKLVHTNGKADEDFSRRFPQIVIDKKGKIDLDFSLVIGARKAIVSLVKAYDIEAEKAGYIEFDLL